MTAVSIVYEQQQYVCYSYVLDFSCIERMSVHQTKGITEYIMLRGALRIYICIYVRTEGIQKQVVRI